MTDFLLPQQLPAAFRRLNRIYDREGEVALFRTIESSRFHIELGTHFDNLNTGAYNHELVLFLYERMVSSILMMRTTYLAGSATI